MQTVNDITLKVITYTAKYLKKKQNILAVKVIAPSTNRKCIKRRKLAIAFDTSGSMEGDAIENVKHMLRACVRMIVIRKYPIDIALIEFNSDSRVIWKYSGENNVLEEGIKIIDKIRADCSTNIYKAIVRSREYIGKDPGWILLLTDGKPMCGKYTDSRNLGALVGSFHPGVNFQAVGFGDYSHTILSSMCPTYEHMDNTESVGNAVAAYISDILTCSYINCSIHVPYRPDIIIGRGTPESLITGKIIYCGYSVNDFKKYVGKYVIFTGYKLFPGDEKHVAGKYVTYSTVIGPETSEPPEEYKYEYFKTTTRIIINKMLKTRSETVILEAKEIANKMLKIKSETIIGCANKILSVVDTISICPVISPSLIREITGHAQRIDMSTCYTVPSLNRTISQHRDNIIKTFNEYFKGPGV